MERTDDLWRISCAAAEMVATVHILELAGAATGGEMVNFGLVRYVVLVGLASRHLG